MHLTAARVTAAFVCTINLAVAAPTLRLPAEIEHAAWSELLVRYVDADGLVDYRSWKQSPEDLRKLDDYLAQFAVSGTATASGDAEIAALINAYNACTVRWILENHPTGSIRDTKDPWGRARWTIGGRVASLDEIEHKNLRPLYGWKAHATLVCAARSCPPLRREAYTADNLAGLTTEAFRAWLARPDLNRFDTATRRAELSMIFKWYADDFTGDGALPRLLATFAPAEHQSWIGQGKVEIRYLDYDWRLNERSPP